MEQELASLKQEVAAFQLQTLPRLQALEQAIVQFQQSHTTLERLGNLEDSVNGAGDKPSLEERIKTLEDARQKQRELNTTFALKSSLYQPPVNSQPTKSWFKWK